MTDQATVGEVNVDDNPHLAAQYGMRSIPTVLLFKEGQVVDQTVGVVPKQVLAEKLRALVSAATYHTCQVENAVVSGGPMKNLYHPASIETDITCTCGATVHTRSTVPNMRVAVCSNCHPFFTGRHPRVDAAGRVEVFRKKYSTPLA